VLGIAFDAQILALRADEVGSCSGDTPGDASLNCVFADREIARGIDFAINSGATVINISLGGGNASQSVINAVGRAASAGVVIVVSAGNGGDGSDPDIDPNQPDPFATDLLAAGDGNVIIVGSIDEDGVMSDFSNRAGLDAAGYLNARGEGICCVYDEGEVFVETVNGTDFVTLFSGTSFAAPQVSGAVALLKQAFPNLTGQEIVEILLDSAQDAGESGLDEVYGAGILDIAAAFAPSGTTQIAGTRSRIALGDTVAVASAAMGDALSGASLSAVVTDKYDRAYTYELGRNTRNPSQVQRLRGAVQQTGLSRSSVNEAISMAFTIGEGARGGGLNWADQLRLTREDAQQARVLAARVAARIAPDLQLGFALAQGTGGLVGHLQGASRPAFRIAPQADRDNGFLESGDFAVAARKAIGAWGVTLSAEHGHAWLGVDNAQPRFLTGVRERSPVSSFAIGLDNTFDGWQTNLSLAWMAEQSTVLGGHFHESLGIAGSDSLFFDASFRKDFDGAWQIGAAMRQGITRPRGNQLIGQGSQIDSQSWSIDVTKWGWLSSQDSLGFRLSQPLRVSGGGLNFELPTAYDYATESAVFGTQVLSLSPEGRELMSELAWNSPLGIGWGGLSAFHRRQPGHFVDAPDDIGAIISFGASF